MTMRLNKTTSKLCTLALAAVLLAGCAGQTASGPAPASSAASAPAATAAPVAEASEMVTPESVVEEGMTPITAEALRNGVYAIEVRSSSSMFKIVACELTVAEGRMTAVMTMNGTGYLKIYPGTGEEAAAAPESDCIPFGETADGMHTFTLPVEALDAAVPCAAFSKKKEKWYDRELCFLADSLPDEAFAEGRGTTADALALADGLYTAEVTLAGGSGRAGVQSPAALQVENGAVYATILWDSANYDYMKVDDVLYDPLNETGNSEFRIPVAYFDAPLTVLADTTAMSTPHEIAYTLTFDSATLEPVAP